MKNKPAIPDTEVSRYLANNVRDRILLWQDESGVATGGAEAPNNALEASNEIKDDRIDLLKASRSASDKEVVRKRSSQTVKQTEMSDKARKSATNVPHKRIVSDSHWMQQSKVVQSGSTKVHNRPISQRSSPSKARATTPQTRDPPVCDVLPSEIDYTCHSTSIDPIKANLCADEQVPRKTNSKSRKSRMIGILSKAQQPHTKGLVAQNLASRPLLTTSGVSNYVEAWLDQSEGLGMAEPDCATAEINICSSRTPLKRSSPEGPKVSTARSIPLQAHPVQRASGLDTVLQTVLVDDTSNTQSHVKPESDSIGDIKRSAKYDGPKLQRRHAKRSSCSPIRNHRQSTLIGEISEINRNSLNCVSSAPSSPSRPEAGQAITSVPRHVNDTESATDILAQVDEPGKSSSNSSQLASHADLISVLSLPQGPSRKLRSARSIQRQRSRLDAGQINQIMRSLELEEAQYTMELQSLAEKIIPALLNEMLLRSRDMKSNVSHRSPEATEDLTKSVVVIGVSLERLKTLHRRNKFQDYSHLLTWAQGAQRVYSEYIKAWRLGLPDLLMPEAQGRSASNSHKSQQGTPIQTAHIDSLLARPLLRIRSLSKSISRINLLKPSLEAAELSLRFQGLVEEARIRYNEEMGRMEDEAATSMDTSQIIEFSTLDPVANFQIFGNAHVKARDSFTMTCTHSSGRVLQRVVELILRDGAHGSLYAGDLLICSLSEHTKSLMFIPLVYGTFMAKSMMHDKALEISVFAKSGTLSHEDAKIILVAEDSTTCLEWVDMLSANNMRRTPETKCTDQPSNTPELNNVASTCCLGESGLDTSQKREMIGENETYHPDHNSGQIPWLSSKPESRSTTPGVTALQPPDSDPLSIRVDKFASHRSGCGQARLNDISCQQLEITTVPQCINQPVKNVFNDSLPPEPRIPHTTTHEFTQDKVRSVTDRMESKQAAESTKSLVVDWARVSGPVIGSKVPTPRLTYSPSNSVTLSSVESELENDSLLDEIDSISLTDASSDFSSEERDVPMPLFSKAQDLTTATVKIPQAKVSATDKRDTGRPSIQDQVLAPAQTSLPKMIASIFTWSETGSWQSLHPDECSITVSAGLIEVFEMSAGHSLGFEEAGEVNLSRQSSYGQGKSSYHSNDRSKSKPLISLELTPLVPLRKGTALDISVRSPPLTNSRLNCGNNVMFRSRNSEECEVLYSRMNWSRIHNPTYIAIQNASNIYHTQVSSSRDTEQVKRSTLKTARFSWLGGIRRSSSYRAKSNSPASVNFTINSAGAMSTAFSAFKRMSVSGTARPWINGNADDRSCPQTVSGSASIMDSESADTGRFASRANTITGMVANLDGTLGLKDTRIRLYVRENASRWRDLGSARLNILKPNALEAPRTTHDAHQRRITVHGSTKGEVLLDVQLGENCFERVARTGIAISVWKDDTGPNGEIGVINAVGGVTGGRAEVYMIQMKSEVETAYTYSLVGRQRC